MSVRVARSAERGTAWYGVVYNSTRGYAVRCDTCNWRGYRRGLECECYEEWSAYCTPWSPGPGCPSGILYRCPRCCWPNDCRTHAATARRVRLRIRAGLVVVLETE